MGGLRDGKSPAAFAAYGRQGPRTVSESKSRKAAHLSVERRAIRVHGAVFSVIHRLRPPVIEVSWSWRTISAWVPQRASASRPQGGVPPEPLGPRGRTRLPGARSAAGPAPR